MIQKEMLEYQDIDLELEKIKNTVGKSPDNVIRVQGFYEVISLPFFKASLRALRAARYSLLRCT